MEKGECVPAADELVAELKVAADPAENFDVREKGGDLHGPGLERGYSSRKERSRLEWTARHFPE
jgi:hypothetical protein